MNSFYQNSVRKFIERLKNGPKGDAMIIGVNRSSIERNVLALMYEILGVLCSWIMR